MADTYELDPAVRVEEILNGDDIEPTNRLEYFLKKAASGGGGGGAGVFRVDMLYDEDDEETESLRSSKTLSEIISAANSGLLPYLFIDNGGFITIYNCSNISADHGATFTSVNFNIDNGNILALDAEAITVHADGYVAHIVGVKNF